MPGCYILVESREKSKISPQLGKFFVFLLVLLGGYACAKLIKVEIPISFFITDLDGFYTFDFQFGDILEFIIWSFFLPIAGYWLIESNLDSWKKNDLVPGKKEKWITYVTFASIILISAGNIVHVFFNFLNSRLKWVTIVTSEDIYAFIYSCFPGLLI